MFRPDRELCPVPEPVDPFANRLSGSGTGKRDYCSTWGDLNKPYRSAPYLFTCRLPDDGATIVERSACSEWYHVACIPLFKIDAD